VYRALHEVSHQAVTIVFIGTMNIMLTEISGDELMVLKNVLDLLKSIDESRQGIYELTKNRDLTDPEVVCMSQQLDRKIIMLQKIIYELRSLKIGTTTCRAYTYK